MPFFAAFMIFIILWYEGDRGDSFVPFSFMGACWNWLSPCPVSGRQLVPSEMKWIHYYLKAPYPKKKRKKKKRDVCMTFLQILFTLKCFRCPPLRKFSTRYVWLSLSLSGQPEHLQIQWCFCVVVFFFFCFVMRWWCLEFLLAAPLPLHARNVVLESEIGTKRKSSLPQTPSAQFLEGQRFLFPELDQLSNWDSMLHRIQWSLLFLWKARL